MRDNEETTRRAILAAGDELPGADHMFWDGNSYMPDADDPPEIYVYTDGTERFYVYSTGEMERFDNTPTSVEELEQTALAVLGALRRAYYVQDNQDRLFQRTMDRIRKSGEYTHRVRLSGTEFHIAYSIMGSLKRVNVAADEDGYIRDDDCTKQWIERIRTALT